MVSEEGEPTLLCTGRAHNRGTPDAHTCTRSLFLSLSFAHTTYPTTLTRSRERNRESAEEHVYAPVCVGWNLVYGPVPVHSGMLSPSRESAFVFPVISRRAAPRRATPRDVRTCVSTCERAVCLHARRQRHAVPHTQLTRRLGGPGRVSSRARATASRFTYIRYDTSEPQGRQVAHKTKETRERRYGESKTVTGRDRGRAREAKNRPGKKGREREAERKTERAKRAGAGEEEVREERGETKG